MTIFGPLHPGLRQSSVSRRRGLRETCGTRRDEGARRSTRATLALLVLLFGTSCKPAPQDQVGVLHVPDDPTKVLLVNGHRLTGDVPVSFRDGGMYLADQFVDEGFRANRTLVRHEYDFLKLALGWQGPTLIVFAGPEPNQPPERHISGRERAVRGIAEIAAIEEIAARGPDPIPARGADDVLPATARAEIAARVRAHPGGS